jgi:hypothetical protein
VRTPDGAVGAPVLDIVPAGEWTGVAVLDTSPGGAVIARLCLQQHKKSPERTLPELSAA